MGTLTDLGILAKERELEPLLYLSVDWVEERQLTNGGSMFVVQGSLNLLNGPGDAPVTLLEEGRWVFDDEQWYRLVVGEEPPENGWDGEGGLELAVRLAPVLDEVSTIGASWNRAVNA